MILKKKSSFFYKHVLMVFQNKITTCVKSKQIHNTQIESAKAKNNCETEFNFCNENFFVFDYKN
ncbi:hypothetical protein BpHYR1_014307 [Brachionus plicatilis]|uniref:Uncharacterized protein n=1 Tax=Brachionus plicatilis TaxID=10195 RepID=A0A3M7RPP2_BRAPC|nr:hypothetical protein BpHYR1_014307 [Brachionus plicatilis]